MHSKVPTREEAFRLLSEYNKSESLIKHALAVEGVMRYCARKRGEDEEKWGVIGLVHDLDYEQYPDHHCSKSEEILRANDWPEEYIRAVVSHGWGICSDAEPQTELEKVLYVIDELRIVDACTPDYGDLGFAILSHLGSRLNSHKVGINFSNRSEEIFLISRLRR